MDRKIPELPKSQYEYVEEWIDWLAQEMYEILGPEGGLYSEEPLAVYAHLQDLLRQYLDELSEYQQG